MLPRGVLQRNSGLAWLRSHLDTSQQAHGVLYFADDDNTYDLRIFDEVRVSRYIQCCWVLDRCSSHTSFSSFIARQTSFGGLSQLGFVTNCISKEGITIAFIRPSILLFTLYLLNQLTLNFDLELLHMNRLLLYLAED